MGRYSDTTSAVLDVPNAHRVPVSRNYYDSLAALL